MTRYKFKDNVELKNVLKRFKETDTSYELDGPFDEYIIVNKTSKVILQSGYNGWLADMWRAGLLEEFR